MSKRSPGRNNRKWVRDRLKHVRKRALERYGLDITDDEIRALHERIATFLSERIPDQTLGVYEASKPTLERPYVIYAITLQDVWLPVIYEHGRGVIHTILPSEVLPRFTREPIHDSR